MFNKNMDGEKRLMRMAKVWYISNKFNKTYIYDC